MSPLHPVAPRKSEESIVVVPGSELTYYPITESDIQVIIVLWVLFLVTSLFVGLRLYSRVKILQFYALEDYLYNMAFVSYIHYIAFSFCLISNVHAATSACLTSLSPADALASCGRFVQPHVPDSR